MNIDEIRARHESNDLWIEADTDGWQAHQDRAWLLDKVAELEEERDALKEIIDDGCPRCDCDIVLWLGKAVSDE
jgi:hypothetical protein